MKFLPMPQHMHTYMTTMVKTYYAAAVDENDAALWQQVKSIVAKCYNTGC